MDDSFVPVSISGSIQPDELLQRILGSLAGACIGDALGAPSEGCSIAEIHRLWGSRVETFYEPPPDSPFTSGRRAGQITDDSSILLCLVDAYIANGLPLTPQVMAQALLNWADNPDYFPRFAGPSTIKGIERLRAGGDPALTGRQGTLMHEGTSNGAAMRVAPVGLVHPGDAEAAVHDAMISCLPTHATNLAISGAACIAAAVAVAVVPGASLMDVVQAARWGAKKGAQLGSQYGRDVAGPSVVRRLELALERAASASSFDEAIVTIADQVGTGLHTSEAVPAALGIFLAASGDPFLAMVGGASAGADTDTVACIAGSLAGAFRGFSAIPHELYRQVQQANELDLETRARQLTVIALRER